MYLYKFGDSRKEAGNSVGFMEGGSARWRFRNGCSVVSVLNVGCSTLKTIRGLKETCEGSRGTPRPIKTRPPPPGGCPCTARRCRAYVCRDKSDIRNGKGESGLHRMAIPLSNGTATQRKAPNVRRTLYKRIVGRRLYTFEDGRQRAPSQVYFTLT